MTDKKLKHLYLIKRRSVSQIAEEMKCSQGRVNYWLQKYQIPKRTIAEAIYIRKNPKGDPFTTVPIISSKDAFLAGLGMGLYWGEGTKQSETSVRLGNTDPYLIRLFLKYLRERYQIEESKIRYGIQIFRDMDPKNEETFWCRFLGASQDKFYKTIITPSRGEGTYRRKSEHGVLTVYFHNKKLRNLLMEEIERIKKFS